MNGRGKSKIITGIIATLAIFVLAIIAYVNNNISKNQTVQSIADPEILKSLNYEQVSEEEEKGENEYVKFLAFFTRDLDGDGYAEKLKGTCRDIKETDELYIDLNVLTEGYLKDGKITLNAENFTWETAIVSDNIVDGNYIGENTEIKLQDNIPAGSQKLLWGTVRPNINNNINNYSKEATVTLTGIHVSDDGTTETPINKTVKVIVDWHGSVGAKIEAKSVNSSTEKIIKENDSVKFQVSLCTYEPCGELLLKENDISAIIPTLNGYAPKNVTTSEDYSYNPETKVLNIKRNSEVDENGIVMRALSRTNTYVVNIEYPMEAYVNPDQEVTLEVPFSTYYVAYNNINEEFANPITSEIDNAVVVVHYRKPTGNIYDFNIIVGEDVREGYVVSKAKPLKIYNGIAETTDGDNYTVRWGFISGSSGNITKMTMRENPERYTDEFLNTSKEFSSMEKYIENVGIYFNGADIALGQSGYIKVYNDETNELIHTFNKSTWNQYSKYNMYRFETPVKHIRIETSAVAKDTYFYAYSIKEINDEALVEDVKKEDFDELAYIYSYLQGSVQLDNEGEMKNVTDTGIAKYKSEMSIANISTKLNSIDTQKSADNYIIYINTVKEMYNDSYWKNGQFIVKLPSEIIAAQINDVYTSNSNVKVIGYELYEENGDYFIKIITENENDATYKITIDCNLVADPATKTSTRNISLYAYNEIGDEYYNSTEDIYDVNGNGNLEEKDCYSKCNISFIAPSSIVTSQYISDFDEENRVKVAPSVADIVKEQKNANINVVVLNNYRQNIDEVKILGVIPSEGNSYVVNGADLGSQFSVCMNEKGIQLPDELKDKATIYYSEKINPSKDLSDSNNGWKITPEDWTKVKSYLIDLGDFVIQAGKSYVFSYGIEVPNEVNYNQISYSEHAIYFALNTEGGKILTQTEPNKLGIRIVRLYSCNLVKNKKGVETVTVPQATYLMENIDFNGVLNNKILITNSEGTSVANKLYLGVPYKVKEVKSPRDYDINEKVYEFKVIENEEGKLVLENNNDEYITMDSQNNIVNIKAEDEAKYNLIINKKDIATDQNLENVRFRINGKVYITDQDGKITLERLKVNSEYTVVEESADGYYVLNDNIKFKLIRNNQGELEFESNSELFNNVTIQNTDKEDLIQVSNVNIQNEKIPTYTLKVIKVAENTRENNSENLETLKGARFKLEYKDLDIVKEYITDDDGSVTIPNLYQYVDGKNVTGEYTLQEIEAPDGYTNDMELIKFKVNNNGESGLDVEIENKDELKTIKDVEVEDNILKIFIADIPLFKLVKTDSDTGKPLANVQFSIYQVTEVGEIIDFAKDVNGNYVGELNEENKYVVTTDEAGTIVLPLKVGNYKAVEIKPLEGYTNGNKEEYFNITGAEIEPQIDTSIVEINYIEDLVDLANSVNSGDSHMGKTVKLIRTLDFKDDSSYRNPNDTSYGDLDNDKKIETIKQELANGGGFIPIGTGHDTSFSGIFDGQKNEIKNIYITGSVSDGALFGYCVGCVIQNLGVSGTISGGTYTQGGIAGTLNGSVIQNCYSEVSLNGKPDATRWNSRILCKLVSYKRVLQQRSNRWQFSRWNSGLY